jgi:hypothetical protein
VCRFGGTGAIWAANDRAATPRVRQNYPSSVRVVRQSENQFRFSLNLTILQNSRLFFYKNCFQFMFYVQ